MSELSRSVRKTQAARAEHAVLKLSATTTDRAVLLAAACDVAPALGLTEAWLAAVLGRIGRERRASLRTPRTSPEWAAIFPRYPIDEDGFACALRPDNVDAVKASLRSLGVAVVSVLTPAECDATVAAMFDEINQRTKPSRPAIHPDQPHSWHSRNWPSKSKFLLRRPALHPQAFANRTLPVLYRLFAALWEEERLTVTVDNWGIARGTRKMAFPQDDGTVSIEDRPKWHQEIAPHWDYNPWLFTSEQAAGREPGWQGLLALNDQTRADGCHKTLPGGVPFLERWCAENACPEGLGRKRRSHRPDVDDPIRDWMQDIPLRKGSMVLWSWGQLHASVPNLGPRLRMHQYIRMFPAAAVDPFYTLHDRYAAARVFKECPDALDGVPLSPLGEKLLGVAPW